MKILSLTDVHLSSHAGFAAVELEDDEIEVKFYGVEGDKRIYKSEFSFDEDR